MNRSAGRPPLAMMLLVPAALGAATVAALSLWSERGAAILIDLSLAAAAFICP